MVYLERPNRTFNTFGCSQALQLLGQQEDSEVIGQLCLHPKPAPRRSALKTRGLRASF